MTKPANYRRVAMDLCDAIALLKSADPDAPAQGLAILEALRDSVEGLERPPWASLGEEMAEKPGQADLSPLREAQGAPMEHKMTLDASIAFLSALREELGPLAAFVTIGMPPIAADPNPLAALAEALAIFTRSDRAWVLPTPGNWIAVRVKREEMANAREALRALGLDVDPLTGFDDEPNTGDLVFLGDEVHFMTDVGGFGPKARQRAYGYIMAINGDMATVKTTDDREIEVARADLTKTKARKLSGKYELGL